MSCGWFTSVIILWTFINKYIYTNFDVCIQLCAFSHAPLMSLAGLAKSSNLHAVLLKTRYEKLYYMT